jgi:hypothetical protein
MHVDAVLPVKTENLGWAHSQDNPVPQRDIRPTQSGLRRAAARRELGQRAMCRCARCAPRLRLQRRAMDHRPARIGRAGHPVLIRQAELREAGVAPLPLNFGGLPLQVSNPALADLMRQARGPGVVEAAFVDGHAGGTLKKCRLFLLG